MLFQLGAVSKLNTFKITSFKASDLMLSRLRKNLVNFLSLNSLNAISIFSEHNFYVCDLKYSHRSINEPGTDFCSLFFTM